MSIPKEAVAHWATLQQSQSIRFLRRCLQDEKQQVGQRKSRGPGPVDCSPRADLGQSARPLKTPPGNDSPGSGELAGQELAQTLKGPFTARKTLDGHDRIGGFKKREGKKKKTGREKLREPTAERLANVLPLATDVTESGRQRRRDG